MYKIFSALAFASILNKERNSILLTSIIKFLNQNVNTLLIKKIKIEQYIIVQKCRLL